MYWALFNKVIQVYFKISMVFLEIHIKDMVGVQRVIHKQDVASLDTVRMTWQRWNSNIFLYHLFASFLKLIV